MCSIKWWFLIYISSKKHSSTITYIKDELLYCIYNLARALFCNNMAPLASTPDKKCNLSRNIRVYSENK